MNSIALGIGVAVILAGCASAPAANKMISTASGTIEHGPRLLARSVLVDSTGTVLYEADAECAMGGGPKLERTNGLIANGTSELEVNVTVDPTYTGLQVGYSVDGGPKTWLDPISGASGTQKIPVQPEQTESREPRWEFYYQLNVPAARQPCYTGVGTGHRSIHIETVPGDG